MVQYCKHRADNENRPHRDGYRENSGGMQTGCSLCCFGLPLRTDLRTPEELAEPAAADLWIDR
jgi:hypothetical protein